jgi:hypothetical protein
MSTRLLLEYSVGVLAIVCGALGALFMCTMGFIMFRDLWALLVKVLRACLKGSRDRH